MLNRRESLNPASDVPLQAYMAFIIVSFIVILCRLFYLQVHTGVELKISSLGNIIQDFATPAPRGNIYDRGGRPLAKNKQVFKLLYIRPPDLERYLPSREDSRALKKSGQLPLYANEKTGQPLKELVELASFLGVQYQDLMKRVEKETRKTYGNQPITLADNLSYPQVVYIEENRDRYPRLLIDEYAFERVYPLGTKASHLIGYTGSMGPSENNALKELGYPQNEVVGKEGAERAYEELLHGTPGIRYIRLNRSGLGVDFLRESSTDRSSAQYQVTPAKGSDLYLTVDAGLQNYSFDRLAREGHPGAVVINSLAKGHEGEILALVSNPGFDPLRLKDDAYYASLMQDRHVPFNNRAFSLSFEPGSTFKIVTTAAALQSGKFTLNSGFYCSGKLKVGNKDFYCHNRTGHGGLNLLTGFAKSCDVVFYTVGRALPDEPDTLHDYATYFGYGKRVGIDLAGELQGVVPDEAEKREARMRIGIRHEVDLTWYDGDTVNYAIGQGDLRVTPLQDLWSASTVAWGGVRYPPKLLYAKQADNRTVRMGNADAERTPLKPATLDAVRQCMRAAASAGGTCHLLGELGMEVCAKSGTAQNNTPGEHPHSWVVGFYPETNPRYGFVVFVENGGESGEAAIPVAHDVLSYMKKHEIIPAGEDTTPSR